VSAPPSDAALDRLLHGGSGPLPPRVPVRAGPLSLVVEAGDLRNIRLGSREIIRRIYGAVRDEQWRTIPGQLSDVRLATGEQHFSLSYTSTHRDGDVAFAWHATIDGTVDGVIRVRFEGTALATFRKNRIGLCVLHPTREGAGARVRATCADGSTRALRFPDLVSVEQPIVGFQDLAVLAWEVRPDVWAEVALSGDLFETEDQRNWIDASYKTYSTPLSRPMPVVVSAGTTISQSVTLRLSDEAGGHVSPADPVAVVDADEGTIRFGDGLRGLVPSLGLRLGTWRRRPQGNEPPGPEAARLGALGVLGLAHLRVDLRFDNEDWRDALASAVAIARELRSSRPIGPWPQLELALHLPEPIDDTAAALSGLTIDPASVARLLVFTNGRETTAMSTRDAVRVWRAAHGWHALAIATGTTGDLYRLHRRRPSLADVVCWSMQPQAHAVDVTSIAETPEGARDQVTSVQEWLVNMPVAVSVTLGPAGAPDPRQSSLFGAGWTLAMIRALGEAGAGSLTLGDAAGPGGVLDDNGLFPVFHVLAAIASVRHAGIRPTTSTLDAVVALALDDTRAQTRTVLLANLSPLPRVVSLPDPGGAWVVRRLDAETAAAAARDVAYFTRPGTLTLRGGRLELPAFGLARLDGASG
jgi:D-apionolactonase